MQSRGMNYAEVAVNSPGAQRQTFCYSVSPDIMVGHAVLVPFGPRLLQGVVLELTEHPSVEDTREVAGLIDPRPLISSPSGRTGPLDQRILFHTPFRCRRPDDAPRL